MKRAIEPNQASNDVSPGMSALIMRQFTEIRCSTYVCSIISSKVCSSGSAAPNCYIIMRLNATFGASQPSLHRRDCGRYRGHSGQKVVRDLNCSGANDPKRAIATEMPHRGCQILTRHADEIPSLQMERPHEKEFAYCRLFSRDACDATHRTGTRRSRRCCAWLQ